MELFCLYYILLLAETFKWMRIFLCEKFTGEKISITFLVFHVPEISFFHKIPLE